MPTVGGDTLFASMYAAHKALSEGLRQTFSGLRAVHSSRHVFGKHRIADDRIGNSESAQQDALHPVIITHPDSGRKALYVNSNFTTHIGRMSRGGVESATRLPLSSRREPQLPVSLQVGGRIDRHVGQPRDLAHRDQRLSRSETPDASHHPGRCSALGLTVLNYGVTHAFQCSSQRDVICHNSLPTFSIIASLDLRQSCIRLAELLVSAAQFPHHHIH